MRVGKAASRMASPRAGQPMLAIVREPLLLRALNQWMRIIADILEAGDPNR
jgi:hypothetical protein